MKMKSLFKNWPLKLLALGIALLIWLLIMIYSDPSATRTITNVPITVTNSDIFSQAGKSYTVEGRLATSVRVTGPTSIVRNLTAGDFTATADLSQMYDVTGQVPISLTCTARGASSINYSLVTASMKIKIEDILTRRFEVKVETQNAVAEGYLLGNVNVDPATITVKAPESVIERIADVKVVIDLTDLTENASFTCEPVFYSTLGTELDLDTAKDTTFSHEEVEVNVEIWTMKTVPVVINVAGQEEVASGYRYTGAMQSVSQVKVSGLRTRLAALTSVTIPETDLSVAGASADKMVDIALSKYLPEGIDLLEGEPTVLTVTLQVAPLIIKSYEVGTVELKGRNSNYEYILHNMPLTVQLRALEEDFKGITDDHIAASLDVAGYGPGEYNLPVNITVDSVFELYGTVRVNLSVIDPTQPETTEANVMEGD